MEGGVEVCGEMGGESEIAVNGGVGTNNPIKGVLCSRAVSSTSARIAAGVLPSKGTGSMEGAVMDGT